MSSRPNQRSQRTNQRSHLKLHNDYLKSVIYSEGNWNLKCAVSMGNVQLASKLLTSGQATLDYCESIYSILGVAIDREDVAMVRLLIDHGVNLNPLKANKVPSPLWTATMQNSDEIAEMLIRAGADVNERWIAFNDTLLHVAASSGDRRRVELLLNYGADVNAKNALGANVLNSALIQGDYDVVELLLSRGAEVNAADNGGVCALHHAAKKNDTIMMTLLLRYGADVTAVDNHGSNALHYAACSVEDNTEVTDLLLQSGVPVNVSNALEFTPMHCAIANKKNEMVELLIRYGANIHEKMRTSGDFPLIMSITMGNISLSKFLLEQGCRVKDQTHEKQTPLHEACKLGSEQLVQILLDYGADVDAVDVEGNTPLAHVQMMIDNSQYYIASMLIKKIAILGDKTDEMNLRIIEEDDRFKKLYDEYRLEIEKMKRMKISDKVNFSYYYVLAEKDEKIITLTRNEEMVSKFESREYLGEFPNYEQMMEEKYKKAKKMAERIMENEELLCETLGDCLTFSIIQHIAQLMCDEN